MFETQLAGPPSPETAAIVLTVDPTQLPRRQALAVMEAAQRLARAAEAVQAAAMAAVAGPGPDPDGELDAEGALLDEPAEEIAVVLGGNRHFGLRRVELARYLRRWLPATAAAMRAGIVGFYEATLVKAAAEGLSDPRLITRLESMVIGKGTRDLARRLRRAAARIDTAGQQKKAEQRRTDRHLEWWKDRDGTGEYGLAGSGPTHLMALLAAAVDAEAKPELPGDCRSVAMRRFDTLIDWARERLGLPADDPDRPRPASGADGGAPSDPPTGEPAGTSSRRCESCGRSGAARVPIQVTMPLGTLLGLESAPGEIVGWGLLDADACRELAADGAWRRWLTDPVSGQLLDVGAREYVPSAALARFIRGRDRCCRWPGCNLPAVRCDLDHRTPFDHDAAAAGRPQVGPTVRENLDPLCRRHHRIKTVTAWASTRDADGGPSAWTSPCGRVYVEPGGPVPAGDLRLDLLQHVERATRAETPQTRLPAATARVPAAAARSEHVPDYPDEPPS